MRLFRVFITSISGNQTDNIHMYLYGRRCRAKWNGNRSKLATSFSAFVAIPNKVGMNLLQLLQLNSLQFFLSSLLGLLGTAHYRNKFNTSFSAMFGCCMYRLHFHFPIRWWMRVCICPVQGGVPSSAESAVAIMRTDRNLTNGEISHQRFSLHTVSSPRIGIDCTERSKPKCMSVLLM